MAEEAAGAGTVAKGGEEAAVVAVARPCRGSFPPEEAWGNFPLLHLLPPPSLPRHHLPLPENVVIKQP